MSDSSSSSIPSSSSEKNYSLSNSSIASNFATGGFNEISIKVVDFCGESDSSVFVDFTFSVLLSSELLDLSVV